MTLEQRARLIAVRSGRPAVYEVALRMLHEAVDEALRRAGDRWPSGKEMEG